MDEPHQSRVFPMVIAYLGLGALIIAVLAVIRSVAGYAAFHAVAEIFAITVAFSTFVVTWNTRRFGSNGYLEVLGVAFLYVGIVDAAHMLAYAGLGIYPGATANGELQLWLAGRFLLVCAVLMAPFFTERRARGWLLLVGWGALTAFLLATIVWGVFPAAVTASGATPFKIAAEWVICLGYLLGLALLARTRTRFDGDVFLLLSASYTTSVLAEIAFAWNADPLSGAGFVAHLLRITGYLLLYRAVIVGTLARPYQVLFRDLSRTAGALSASEERLRVTVESATTGIASYAEDGRILMTNPRYNEITGFSGAELRTMSVQSLTFPDDLSRDEELMRGLLIGEIDEYDLEKRIIRKDGSLAWVRISRRLSPADASGARVFTTVLEDITARRLAEEILRQSRDLNDALVQIDATLNSTDDLDEMFRLVTDSAARAMSADSAALLTREGSVWMPRHTYQFPTDILGQPFSDDLVPQAGIASALGEPLAIEDASSDERVNTDVTQDLGILSVVTIPLTFRDEQLGTLYLNYHQTPHHFTEVELDFCRRLASAVTLAIENTRLNAAQRMIADTLQSALLMVPASLPGVEMAHTYESATELSRIGGDFFDAYSLSEERIGFAVGDVSGKGLEAAAFTAMVRSTLRAFASENEAPGDVLRLANHALARQLEDGRFVTAIFGVLDVQTGRLDLACAGHPEPFFCSETECATRDIVRNPPLGVIDGMSFDQYETQLVPGEEVLLFSDGLLEAGGSSDLFGEKRIHDALLDCRDCSPTDTVLSMLEAARAHAGGRIKDDIVIVALRYLGPPAA